MRTLVHAIPPAIYLACSWCWVIGMLLPVMLVRDFGVWGWVAFAVPNVIGAAAVGWYARGRTGRKILERHEHAVRWFTWWTVAFHVFVLGAIGMPGWIAGFLVLAGWAALRRHVFLLSGMVAVFSMIAAYGMSRQECWAMPALSGARPTSDVVFAAAPLAFGFLLCPALDVTFLRTATRHARVSRWSFGIGFGVFFLALITMSGLYSMWFAREDMLLLGNTGDRPGWDAEGYLLTHFLFAQGVFTIGAHVLQGRDPQRPLPSGLLLLMVAGGFLAWGVIRLIHFAVESGDIDVFWLAYRLFLSAYALPFPAYVFICMIPWRWNASPRRRLVVCAGATLVASPFLAIGYFGDVYALLPFGVVIPIAAPFLAGARPLLRRTNTEPRA
ncbi:MAG: hypothetical protein AAGI30_04980 [Planctomycetota bacterium]